jgi:hypothetical protein
MTGERQNRDGQQAILAIQVERLLETGFREKSSNLDRIDPLTRLVEVP